MKGHSSLLSRIRTLPMAVLVLIAGLVVLYYLFSHTALPAAVVSGVVILIVILHLGLLSALIAPFYALLRRRRRSRSGAHESSVLPPDGGKGKPNQKIE